MEEQKHKEFSEFKTYVIGIPTSTSTRQKPVYVNGSSMTIHGSNLRKMKIFTIMDLTKNREPKIALRPGKNYVVYELTDNGFDVFFGQFSPEPPPVKVKIHTVRKPGLNDGHVAQSQYEQSMQTPIYGSFQSSENPVLAKRMQDNYEMHIKSLQSQLDAYDQKQEALLNSINDRHLKELDRLKEMNDEVLMVLHTQIGKLEGERDRMQGEYFTIQNELLDAKKQIYELTEKLKADAANFTKNLTLAKDKFDFLIHQRDEEVRVQRKIDKATAEGTGLSGLGDGIIEKLIPMGVQALTQWLSDKVGPTAGAPTAQPPIHQGQNLNGVHHQSVQHTNNGVSQPPPRPRPLPMPEREGVEA